MWRDSEEREVFDVWVTIDIFSVSFSSCFIFNCSKDRRTVWGDW